LVRVCLNGVKDSIESLSFTDLLVQVISDDMVILEFSKKWLPEADTAKLIEKILRNNATELKKLHRNTVADWIRLELAVASDNGQGSTLITTAILKLLTDIDMELLVDVYAPVR